MKRNFRTILILLAFLLIFSAQSVIAQDGDSDYFPKTGHNVYGEFYTFYIANPYAELVYGNPITEAQVDPETGILEQYFEGALFQLIEDAPPGERVKLVPLGRSLYEHGEYVNNQNTSQPDCFQEIHWDYPVCSSFHTFYQDFGGEAQFGRPVSGLEFLRGRLVQFFEYAQFIWMPENPADAKIVLGQLGLKYFFVNESDLTLIRPIRNFKYNQSIDEIHVKVFAKQAVLSNGQSQVIDMVAIDQNNAPLTNGIIEVTIKFPDGRETVISQLPTDKDGLANFAFTADSEDLGLVEVIVRLKYNDLVTTAITSFRIWY